MTSKYRYSEEALKPYTRQSASPAEAMLVTPNVTFLSQTELWRIVESSK